jgi:hypothetical protein
MERSKSYIADKAPAFRSDEGDFPMFLRSNVGSLNASQFAGMIEEHA